MREGGEEGYGLGKEEAENMQLRKGLDHAPNR